MFYTVSVWTAESGISVIIERVLWENRCLLTAKICHGSGQELPRFPILLSVTCCDTQQVPEARAAQDSCCCFLSTRGEEETPLAALPWGLCGFAVPQADPAGWKASLGAVGIAGHWPNHKIMEEASRTTFPLKLSFGVTSNTRNVTYKEKNGYTDCSLLLRESLDLLALLQ